MIRAAILGTGWMAHEHALALSTIPGVAVVAVSSGIPERAQRFATQHNIRTAADHATLVESPDVDVVHVCTKNSEHFQLCLSALEHAKHVVAEKPLATTSDETLVLLQRAEAASLVHACNFNYRGYPLIQHARALIQRGEIGDVYLAHGAYTQDWLLHATDHNWRLNQTEAGLSAAVADIGSHWFDLVEHVTNCAITSVSGRLRAAVPERRMGANGAWHAAELDDCGVISFELNNSGIGSLVVSQVSAGRKNHLWFEVSGSKASLAWSQEDPDRLWLGRRDGANQWLMRDATMTPDDPLPAGHVFGWRDALVRTMASVYQRILDPRVMPPVTYATFADGHRTLKLIEAIVRSSSTERTSVPIA